MKPIDKLKGADVPVITTEQLHKAGAFGVAVPPVPKAGEVWFKPSFPLPTVVSIISVQDGSIRVRDRGRVFVVATDLFLSQGFRREGAPLSQNEALALSEASRKPVDERIDDAFDRLVTLANEDKDFDLVAVVGVIRALWMDDAVPLAWRALAGIREPTEEGADHAD